MQAEWSQIHTGAKTKFEQGTATGGLQMSEGWSISEISFWKCRTDLIPSDNKTEHSDPRMHVAPDEWCYQWGPIP